MKLINEYYEGNPIESVDFNDHHFEYRIKDPDFILRKSGILLESVENVQWYTLSVGKMSVELPGPMFIMVADISAMHVDWVRVEECIGRDLSTALYFSELDPLNFTVEDVRVSGVLPKKKMIVPKTKNLIPILVGSNRMMFISETDAFIRTKKMDFSCLY